VVTGAQAIHQFAVSQPFPIEIGLDNYGGDTNLDYQSEMDQAAVDGMSWLWWRIRGREANDTMRVENRRSQQC
jgi:hypothetical protein